ncbi:hypothetical protein Tco_0938679 [Tanacetum coccineum]|uniref:DUF4218 domain-containing protein n=1 Tax=Tanacetum coccineum TaxID=301880 RepID=A0ABQ5DPW0_9ASTR
MYDNVEDTIGDNDQEKLQTLLEDSQKPLYASCTKFSVLSGVLKLFGVKAKHRWTDASFTYLLEGVREILPDVNELPLSLYQAKKMTCLTEFKVERIHACLNDCILYRDTYANIHRFHICKESRLKRLLANGKDAKLLRWHSDERKKDGKLRHVADSPQWRNINNKYGEFGGEIKNIRFGLSLDGINPFGNMSSNHNTWPVLLCVYNLPHWLCMKRKYIMMSLLIEGPKQPGNDIDVYLAPLVVDLKTLWNKGIKVYDAYKKKNFTLRAMIFCTISDFPAYAFFQGIVQKVNLHVLLVKIRHLRVIDHEVFDSWQSDIIFTLCELEMYFSPSFFDVMVHIVGEIKACGSVFLRYMYPFERYMGILKGYVRIGARPEGNIVIGYLGEELIEFGNDVVKGVGNIGIPHSRHEGRLSGVGTIGLRKIDPDRDALKVAHSVVLQHMTLGKDPFTRLLGGEPGQNHQLLEKKNGLGNVDVRKCKVVVDVFDALVNNVTLNVLAAIPTLQPDSGTC